METKEKRFRDLISNFFILQKEIIEENDIFDETNKKFYLEKAINYSNSVIVIEFEIIHMIMKRLYAYEESLKEKDIKKLVSLMNTEIEKIQSIIDQDSIIIGRHESKEVVISEKHLMLITDEKNEKEGEKKFITQIKTIFVSLVEKERNISKLIKEKESDPKTQNLDQLKSIEAKLLEDKIESLNQLYEIVKSCREIFG